MILRGQFVFHLRDLHALYGPIIRFNPDELHISDPFFFDTLYASGAGGEKRDKFERYTNQVKIPGSIINTVSHDQHKMRRAPLNRFFSTTSVRKLQPMIERKIGILLKRFEELKNVKGIDGVIDLNYAYAAFTGGKFYFSKMVGLTSTTRAKCRSLHFR